MRRTVIESLEAARDVPYDPDQHPMLDIRPTLSIKLLEKGPRVLTMRFEADFRFIEQKTEREHGKVHCVATVRVDDETITEDPSTTPDNIFSLLQGGIGDEVLLPASVLCRSMRLPALVMTPVRLNRETFTKPPPAATKKKRKVKS